MQNLNHEEQNLLKRIARDVSYITRDLHFGYLNVHEVAALLGMKTKTIQNGYKSWPDFPKPFVLRTGSKRGTLRWSEREVRKWAEKIRSS